MIGPQAGRLRVLDCEVDPLRRCVTRGDAEGQWRLTPKALRVLLVLVQSQDQTETAMQMHTIWSDRGGVHGATGPTGDDLPGLMLASRGGSLSGSGGAASAWLVLRGSATLACREGHFALAAGQWLVLEGDAGPLLHAAEDGLVLGVALSPRLPVPGAADGSLFPGLGRLAPGARAAALRLWCRCAPFARNASGVHEVERLRLEAVLRLLAAQQAGLRELVDRCPGRSLRRRRQAFVRMQRAWLYLAGNLDRPVRLAELAERGNVSVWHFTKTFHALYGEGPQAASTRMRLAHAARLLRGSRLSVGEAGAACGFENHCSFSRAFRARFGMPPSRYRVPVPGAPPARTRSASLPVAPARAPGSPGVGAAQRSGHKSLIGHVPGWS